MRLVKTLTFSMKELLNIKFSQLLWTATNVFQFHWLSYMEKKFFSEKNVNQVK